MLFLRTGLPGASKTLNTLREIIQDISNKGRQLFYNNIKILLLDLDVCNSFQGFFYGYYYERLDKIQRKKVDKVLKVIHQAGELASLDTFPHLQHHFSAYIEGKGPLDLFIYWCRRVYPKERLVDLENYLSIADTWSTDDIQRFHLHWQKLERPELWFELPHGSIIVLDECQDFFPCRPAGSRVPEHYARFEKHRHQGFDIHLVTQNAKFLDSHVRNLSGRHVHYVNNFGSSRVTRMENEKVFDPEDYFARQKARVSNITRNKDFYGLYWSADAHTHKLQLPWQIIVLPIAFILLISALVWFFTGGVARLLDFSPSPEKDPTAENASLQPSSNQQPQTEPGAIPVAPEPLFYPHTRLLTDNTPLAKLCTSFDYAGNLIQSHNNGKTTEQVVYHLFNCAQGEAKESELSSGEDEPKKTVLDGPQLVLDDLYLASLGFTFKYTQHMPILIYGSTAYIFPRFN